MKEALVIFVLIAGFMLLLCVTKIILMKKSIIYKHVEIGKKITSWDYYNQFDGNWFFKEIDYDKLYETTNDEDILIKKRQIGAYKIISAALFIGMILAMTIWKIINSLN
ncbi:hypothetical protein [Flavobacterium suncheonense]|uniref:Uncharacterized protein n=2 Tax=Flavobacterium suncheonense TaxID=350894 RepID=A0A0A2MQU8_9FLAO|nr:hypothetical protein [Flavobacterium suncheonense]KGO90625.1 hypothetical protein Q764_00440 [Flavobacterium suncheonense GH29-5 = DSM 17707]